MATQKRADDVREGDRLSNGWYVREVAYLRDRVVLRSSPTRA
jgi:hypothetical protein